MQEYMYEVCLCSVWEGRSHMETLFTRFSRTGREGGGVCRVGHLMTCRKNNLKFKNLNDDLN